MWFPFPAFHQNGWFLPTCSAMAKKRLLNEVFLADY